MRRLLPLSALLAASACSPPAAILGEKENLVIIQAENAGG